MFELVCVTNRRLAQGRLLERVEQAARTGASHVVLREKDLPAQEYEALARRVMSICAQYRIGCTIHHFTEVCVKLGAERLHLSLPDLEAQPEARDQVRILGVSVHSVEQARRAAALGADYVTAGHVFGTDCKPGLPGRGLTFLREVCAAVPVPVYAIGGITKTRLAAVRDAGAAGAFLMSAFM